MNEIDLTAYEQAPVITNPAATCEWCDDPADEEQGPLRRYKTGEAMHTGCAWSNDHGALRTQLEKGGGSPHDERR